MCKHPTLVKGLSRTLVLAVVLAVADAASAQTDASVPYTPTVPASSSFSAYGDYDSGGGTVEGSALRGMASVISASGDAALSASAAAVNLTQAQKQSIENRQAATIAYFAMQETNRAAREARRSPRLTQEQYVRIAQSTAPARLTSSEVDPVSGSIHWPQVLQMSQFDAERAELEKTFVKLAQFGALGVSDLNAAGNLVEATSVKLKQLVRSVPPQQYIASKNFLKSMMFALTQTQLD